MEEDIKRLEILVNYGLSSSLNEKDISAIENVINRLKEDEAVIKQMSESIVNNNDIEKEICENVHKQLIKCNGFAMESCGNCENCVEQYFREKVKNENTL